MGETDGAVKVIADAANDRVLGIHIPRRARLRRSSRRRHWRWNSPPAPRTSAATTHAHPTFAEALKEAALAVDGRPLNI